MKKLFFVVAICFCQKLSAQVDTLSNLSDAEKIYGLSLFWKEASYNFVYFDKVKINWDSTYQAFIPKVLATKNTFQYYRTIQKFAALLKDGHTEVFQYPRPLIKIGNINSTMVFDYLEDKVVVKHILIEDSSLVPMGSEVVSIDGIPVKKYLEEQVLPFIAASTNQWLYSVAVRSIFPYDTSKSLNFTLKTPNGDFVKYSTTGMTKRKTRLAYQDPSSKYLFFQMLPDEIAYVNLSTFQGTYAVDQFKKYLPELYKAKGIILDMRLNGGGNSGIGEEILKYFTNQKIIKQPTWKTLNHLAAFKAWGSDLPDTLEMSLQDRELMRLAIPVAKGDYWYVRSTDSFVNDLTLPKIKVPLVVLIGSQTASAAEDFLVELSELRGRATLIGEKTEGSTGQPLYFTMPGGGRARICTLRETYPNGQEFVGSGIQPDIEVKRTISDLINGRDGALEKAIEVLEAKTKRNYKQIN